MSKYVIEQLIALDPKELIGKEMGDFCHSLIQQGIFEDESAIQLFILDFLVKAIQEYGADLPIAYVEE